MLGRIMKKMKVQPVIMCGGSGKRLWPLSRTDHPKQYISLFGKESLFQQTYKRLQGLKIDDMIVQPALFVLGAAHYDLAISQLQEITDDESTLILEATGKNTAPALTLGALASIEKHEESILVVLPADHAIADESEFKRVLSEAIAAATNGAVVVMGITPKNAATGYGYIQTRRETSEKNYKVVSFVEKPDEILAEKYVAEGNYYWNAGIFIVKSDIWLKLIREFRPDIRESVEAAWKSRLTRLSRGNLCITFSDDIFQDIPSESIDYAVMEKLSSRGFDLKMIPLDAGWDDLGNWEAIWRVLPKDKFKNAIFGKTSIRDAENNLVYSTDRLIAVTGVEGLVVIETKDSILIAKKDGSEKIKQIVEEIAVLNKDLVNKQNKVYRPWGEYEEINWGENYKVKKISVNPGASLSLQLHNKRSEHWIVIKGTPTVTCGSEVKQLTENQTIFIPQGVKHRLQNKTDRKIEIIEMQYGSYLEEDDIVRFEDQYGRVDN